MFDQLADQIKLLDGKTKQAASKSINQLHTLRNWLIGAYIVEYEQNGKDRADYGEHLLQSLSDKLGEGFNLTLLKNSRTFYQSYPSVLECVRKSPTMSDLSETAIAIRPTVSDKFITAPETLISRLSFSHIVELLTLNDPLVRFFYETECIKGIWSVRELRRQIATNLHIRVGLSEDKMKAMMMTNANAETQSLALQIRDPFTFEFLGIKSKDVVTESDIEEALIANLKDFLLELGKGFCFEAEQKRIIIDDEYYYPDLVFYNRLLHCSIIIELKDDAFKHEYIGQLNAYVNYFAENEMQPGDNPPIGILLCTKKGKKMVEYALGSLDNQLFVSTYQLQLPNKDELEDFLKKETEG